MKLSSILAAAALVAAAAVAPAQAHDASLARGGVRLALARLAAGRPAIERRGGVAQVGFHGGRPGDRRGRHGRFARGALVFPYWGWDCAPDGGCGWDEDGPGMPPTDDAGPPVDQAAPGYAVAAWSGPRAETNECSDWVWRPRLRRSVCVRPVVRG